MPRQCTSSFVLLVLDGCAASSYVRPWPNVGGPFQRFYSLMWVRRSEGHVATCFLGRATWVMSVGTEEDVGDKHAPQSHARRGLWRMPLFGPTRYRWSLRASMGTTGPGVMDLLWKPPSAKCDLVFKGCLKMERLVDRVFGLRAGCWVLGAGRWND
jgi:hypothetical protein